MGRYGKPISEGQKQNLSGYRSRPGRAVGVFGVKIVKTHWMTRREWVEKHKPVNADEVFVAGVKGCPEDYDFSDAPVDCYNTRGRKDCERCYKRPAKVGGKYILVRGRENR